MKKGISQNLSMLLLTAIFIHVILTDCMVYFASLEYITANIVVAVCEAILFMLLFKREIVRVTNGYYKWDMLFWAMIVLLCVLSIGFADETWDTYSYHVYLQENPFTDKIYDDFFPGRTLTSFVYPLADRVFYMFRVALGYRLGTLPSYLVLIPMFYGVKKLLRFLVPAMDQRFLSVASIGRVGILRILRTEILCLLLYTCYSGKISGRKSCTENQAGVYHVGKRQRKTDL